MSLSRRFSRTSLWVLAWITAFLVFAAPKVCAAALREGLALCGGPLLLSLYPFLIVSSLLAQCGASVLDRLMAPAASVIGLRAPAARSVLLVGFLGGFAPAAHAAAEAVRCGRLSPQEASALLPACVCSGPSFVVLTVGEQLLGSTELGVRLFLAQLLAGYLAAALLNRRPGRQSRSRAAALPKEETAFQEPQSLDRVIADAAVTYLKLCGFVLYFRLLAAGVAVLLPARLAALPAILLEVSSGCDLASRTGLWASTLCCAALSLQGTSVLLQVRTICPPEISLEPLLKARLIHLPASLALFYLSMPEGAQEAFSTLCGRVTVPMQRVPPDCALLVFFVCCFAVCELCRAAAAPPPGSQPKRKNAA